MREHDRTNIVRARNVEVALLPHWIEGCGRDQVFHFGQQSLQLIRILRPRKVNSKPFGDWTRRSSWNNARARCSARLTAGWLSNSREAAAVTLFSSAIAAKVIRRFKSTWRSFSRRMDIMIIMHEPHARSAASLTVRERNA